MVILGISKSRNSYGEVLTTLQVADDFPAYYNNEEAGRTCVGQKVDTIYLGNYYCPQLQVGMSIDILYEKAVATKSGFFQAVKKIEILSEK